MISIKSDLIQNMYDLSPYNLLSDIIVAITAYLFYLTMPSDSLFKIFGIFFLVLLTRYFISVMTLMQNESYPKHKKHFQINAYIALFTILIMSYNTTVFAKFVIVLLYSIMNILMKNTFTNDAIFTILLTITFYTSMRTIPVKNNVE